MEHKYDQENLITQTQGLHKARSVVLLKLTSIMIASNYGSKRKLDFVGETQKAESPINNVMHLKPCESSSHKNLQKSDEVFTAVM